MGAKRCALLFLWGGCAEGSFVGGGGQSSPDRTDAGRTHRAAGHDVYVAPASFDAVEAGFQSSALHRKWRNRGGEGAVECGIQEGDRGGADGGTLDGTAGSVRRYFCVNVSEKVIPALSLDVL